MSWLLKRVVGYRTLLGLGILGIFNEWRKLHDVPEIPSEAFGQVFEWLGFALVGIGVNGKVNKFLDNLRKK